MVDHIPFKEAIEFLAGKVNLPTRRSSDLKHAAHVRGFSVAGVARDDMLADFRSAIEKARAQGTGFKEFQKDFDAIVERTGWKFFSHGKTEEERRSWRARIIYTTNMRTSYMAGRYAQLTDPDVLRYRPYWQYIHSGALHPRLLHLSWNNMVWRADDPVWKRIYPPNGWGCGCDVEALSERQMRALGKSGPDPSPDLKPYEEIDKRTGQPETRYPGIDRGWDYNVGEEWLHGVVPKELQKPLPAFGDMPAVNELPAMPPATRIRSSELLATDLEPEAYANAFLKPFGVKEDGYGLYRDQSGTIIPVTRTLFDRPASEGTALSLTPGAGGRGQYAGLIAAAIMKPDEIWADWARLGNAIVLRRNFLRRVTARDGNVQLFRVQWTSKGWLASIETVSAEDGLAEVRVGALLYRRKEI